MISEESVEALAVVLAKEDLEWAEADGSTPDLDIFLPAARRTAKRYLEAAAPHMIAQAGAAALEEAADAAEGMHDPVAPDCKEWADWLRARATRTNPYRSQA